MGSKFMQNMWCLFEKSLSNMNFGFTRTQKLHELKLGKFHQSQQPRIDIDCLDNSKEDLGYSDMGMLRNTGLY